MKTSFACVVFFASTLLAPGFEQPQLAPLPNYDRRAEQPPIASRELAGTALRAGRNDVRVDRDPVTQSPQWIASNERFLTAPVGAPITAPPGTTTPPPPADPHRVVKSFLNAQRDLFGHDATTLAAAKITREDVSPSGLRTVVWQQVVDEIPVFEALLKVGLTPRGELVNIGSRFLATPAAAALAGTPTGTPRITPQRAVVLAAHETGVELQAVAVAAQGQAAGAELRQEFTAPGLNGASAQLTWLPMDAGTLRLCWNVILTNQARSEMFLVLIDAQSGAAHVRHGLTEYLSDASYRAFTSDSPTPKSPGFSTPTSGQPPVVARNLVTTSALNTLASPNGWIDDGVNETRGNNVDAHTDFTGFNRPDLPRPQGSPFRAFDFPLDLTQEPSTYSNAAVTNLFYWCNRVHDRYYALGFTEAAGNFQNDNFGRGGTGNDAVLADAQDGGTTNNASFSTPSDGLPGRIQMFLWTGPGPARDGDFDAEVMIHEYTHGMSNRLVGGGVGISAEQTRGMGEGWSDFYGLCLLSEAGDNVDASYPSGGYVSYQFPVGFDQNYYFGIRRYPYSTDLAKNPLTFKDIDPAQASAYAGIPLNPRYPASNANAGEVHRQGELWCNTLWEARANLVKKLGFPAGNEVILQLVTDGMKLAPANPTFLQARDAILQADQITGGAHRDDLWAAFAKRGMGAGATAPASSTTTGVVENFDLPDDLNVTPPALFTASGDLGGPFSPNSQTYTLRNYGAATLDWTAATAQSWMTLSASSGTLTPGQSVNVDVTFNAAATVLEIGTYPQLVTFHNVTSGADLSRTISLTVDPPRAHYFPLDIDPGWLRGGDWAFGQPLGGGGTLPTDPETGGHPDPTSGATGSNVFGANLAGNYARIPDVTNYLTTTALNCSGLTATRLQFQRWLNTVDPSSIEVSRDGANWTTVWTNIIKLPYNFAGVGDFTWRKFQYDISPIADGQATVFIRWSYRYFNQDLNSSGWNIDDIEILGAANNLTVVLPDFATEGDAPFTGTVTASLPPAADLVVSLIGGDPARLTVPASVTIPAGATSATFPLAVVDDALLNGSETNTIRPSAFRWSGHPGTMLVHDNETATLGVSLPANATEGVGTVAGTVTVSAPVASDVLVQLVSSAPGDALPPTVTIPAGQPSAPFALAIVDDGRIDGPRNVTITASVVNWTSGNANITVLDNETTNLTLSVPADANEGDFGLQGLATVSISGTLPANLVVTLSSDDTTEITPAVSVTIPAGQTSVQFNMTVANDTLLDGTQIAHITASTPGFTSATAPIAVHDNEAHHFVFSPVASPQVRGAPFVVSLTAKDVNDETITRNYGNVSQLNPVTRTASNAAGPVSITASTSLGFVQNVGVWTFNVTVNDLASNVVLTASDGQGHTGTSNAFNAGTGPLHHFAWDAIPSPQPAGTFAATVLAFDVGGNPVTSFNGNVNLSAAIVATRPPTGMDTGPIGYVNTPFHTNYSSGRVQTLYPPGALGGAGRLTALSLFVATAPSPTSVDYNWTIRLKHTLNPTISAWENSGWTVVHGSDARIAGTGWATFPFQADFNYDGLSNLLVDITYRNPTPEIGLFINFGGLNVSSQGRVRVGASKTAGTDPLLWGTDPANEPNPMDQGNVLNLQLTTASAVAMQPTAPVHFVNGAWTGNVTVAQPGAAIGLRADDGAGHVGVSGTFTVNPTDADGDGLPDAWASFYGVHGALVDAEGDGLVNLIDYALGFSPKVANTLPAPQLVTDPGDGLKYLTWQYRRLLVPGSLTYAVEASDNLTTWHSDAAWVQQVGTPVPNGDGLTETVTVRALPAITAAPQRSLRLRVTRP